MRVRLAWSRTSRARVITTRGRLPSPRRREEANTRNVPRPPAAHADRDAALREDPALARRGHGRAGARCVPSPQRSSPLPETSAAGVQTPATRQPPRTPIVTSFANGTEAIVRPMDVCYRHPGRETAVSCSNCGRPICPDCMTTTSVGMRCPECAGQTTKVRTAAAVRRGDEPTLTYVLIGLIVLVQLGAMASGASATGSQFGGSDLIRDGAVSQAGDRGRRVLPPAHRRLPARGLAPPGVQRFRAVRPRLDARARRRQAPVRDHLLRLAARRVLRRAAYRARRPHGRRVRGDLRADGGGDRGAAQPGDRDHGERARALARDQPGVHVRDPRHLDRRPPRRADRRRAGRVR